MAPQFKDDATPAYRGYRLQALYTFHRILKLNSQSEYFFHPEGKEDLSVNNSDNNVIEVVQVKAYSGNLTLSNFSIDKESCFFYRIASYLRQNPSLQVSLVTFGTLGPELHNAFNENCKDRNSVAKKLVGAGVGNLTEDEAIQLLERIRPIKVNEQQLTEEVLKILQSSSTGYNPEAAFDLMTFWLYRCSENKTVISRNDLLNKLNNVGKYLAYLAAHQAEWFTTIMPIGSDLPQSIVQNKLSEEFYQGTSARYEHIVANLDVRRPEKIKSIDEQFIQSNVVILHGASGQGKTALAYRYLYERFPQKWCFQIRTIENQQHAYTLTAALLAQVEAIDLPIAIFIDVSPSNTDWPTLVSQLTRHKNIQILVTIREEDYRRASTKIGTEFEFGQVELDLSVIEANEIYQSITTRQPVPKFTSFEEAWARFGGSGPLLEFIYLLTTGALLRERLKQQVNRLQDEARSGKNDGAKELKLLTFISIASAFGAKLKISSIVDTLALSAPQRTFELLEKEYLLRRSPDGFLVDGLHPLRSSILVELLVDPVFSSWSTNTIECLPLIEDTELEIFLLHCFLYRENETYHLISFLNTYQPTKWSALGGICRALLWLGTYKYAVACRELYREVYNFSGSGGLYLLDFDITNVVPDSATQLHTLMDSMIPAGSKREQQLEMTQSWRQRQPDKKQVFNFVNNWLKYRTEPPELPISVKEWSGLAYTLFWSGYLQIDWPIESWVPLINSQAALVNLPAEVLGDLVFGLSSKMKELFPLWIASNRAWLTQKFEEAAKAIVFDDEEKLTVHFIVEWQLLSKSLLEDDQELTNHSVSLHPITLESIRLLRRLLPDRALYACQGYGQNFSSEYQEYDDTRKTGIKREHLPPVWSVEINSTFRGLIEYPFRPDGWPEYTREVLVLRQLVIKTLGQLETSLLNYFRQPKLLKIIGNGVKTEDWDNCKKRLTVAPLLPATISDPWGFVDELSDSSDNSSNSMLLGRVGLVTQRYQSYHKAFSTWRNSLLNFYTQALHAIVINPILAKQAKSEDQKRELFQNAPSQGLNHNFVQLSVYNLTETLKVLPNFQLEFKNLLSGFVPEKDLTSLQNQERELLVRVWSLWYIFALTPAKKLENLEFTGPKILTTALNKLRSNVSKELRNCNKTSSICATILTENTSGSRRI